MAVLQPNGRTHLEVAQKATPLGQPTCRRGQVPRLARRLMASSSCAIDSQLAESQTPTNGSAPKSSTGSDNTNSGTPPGNSKYAAWCQPCDSPANAIWPQIRLYCTTARVNSNRSGR